MGFQHNDPEKRTAIARKGGSSVPDNRRSFFTNPELARAAGRKGGAVCRPKPTESMESPK